MSSILHFHEIAFPLYTRDEVKEILCWRVMHGFYPGVMTEKAFEMIVDLVARNGDIRYGIVLIASSWNHRRKRASRKIEVEDVIAAREGEEMTLLAKNLSPQQ